MDTSLLTRGLVRFDWDVEDQRAVFAGMAAVLQAEGFVKKSFEAAIVAREAKYPTALPTVPEAIAIPPADAEHILPPFLAPLRLAHPVPWSEMGNDKATHPVRLVFMLGLDKAEGQLEVLQAVVQAFQDSEFVSRLNSASTAEEYFAAVQSIGAFVG